MHRFFFGIHKFVNRNKVFSVAIALGILAVMGYFGFQLRFEEDVTKLLPTNDKSSVTAKVLKQLRFTDKISVIFEAKAGGTPMDLQEQASVFLDSLEKSARPFYTEVQGRVAEQNIDQTIDFVFSNLPLFLNEQDYVDLSRKISADSIAQTVEANYRSLISPSGLITRDFIQRDPFGISFVGLKKLQQLSLGDDFILENGYVMTSDKKMLLLFIVPGQSSSETEKNTIFAQKLYAIRDRLNASTNKVQTSYFGTSLIAVANATQIKGDVMFTTIVAMSALMVILMLFYRKISIPVIIFIPTLFGAAFAFALLYFAKGTISAISVGIGAILIGITIDYSLHILTHFKHNTSIAHVYQVITKPLFMSSTTTAIAFLCLLFVKSEALQDLGIFAAAIVMGSAFFSLLIVPHVYKPSNETQRENFIDRMAGFSFDSNKWLIGASLLLVAISFFTAGKVDFNSDLSQLNYIPKDIRAAEKQLERNSSLTSKTIYLATYGATQNEALAVNARLFKELMAKKAKGSILNFSSVGGIVLPQEQQQERIDKWNAFWPNEKVALVKSSLVSAGEKVGFKPTAYEPFYALIARRFTPVTTSELEKIDALQLKEFVSDSPNFHTVSTMVRVSNEQRQDFVKSVDGLANVVAIDRQQMNETFLTQLRDDFNTLVNYSLLAVILVLFVFFRRIELVVAATIPILLTGLVTAGVMWIFGIELNIFSTIVCTLIFGHGVDFSIFMTSALQKEYTDGINERKVYRTSIILAAITTILGVGALIFAGHPSLRSISSAALIGIFAAICMIFILYPILFRLLFFARVEKGFAPIRLGRLLHSSVSLLYYAIGGFLVSLIGFVILKINPASEHKKLRAFHWIMSKYMNSVFYTYPSVTRSLRNPQREDFIKPAIIIANHTSFLDVMAMGGMNPRIIFLVSDHVYNNPIIGAGVRMAGFYPASHGLEGGVEHLREKIDQGFSIMIFPEGTRSEDNSIKRFHKGAFFLAQEFQIDILPVLIHGYSEVAPKNDFILNGNKTVIEILPRISPSDTSFGSNYAQRSKQILAYMRERFSELRKQQEGPGYWKKYVIGSFDFKEQYVVDAVRKSMDQNLELYFILGTKIPAKVRMLHLADDYGQLDVLLALQQSQRRIDSSIADIEKRRVARTNHLVIKREIRYPEMLEASYELVLVSSKKVDARQAAIAPIVILLDNAGLLPDLERLGYSVAEQIEKLIVLKRESQI